MGFFNTKQKTEKELQAELKALSHKMSLVATYSDLRKYEELLREIYLIGSKPETIVITKK